MTDPMGSRPGRQSQSRKSTTIVTDTGSGVMETKSSRSTSAPLVLTTNPLLAMLRRWPLPSPGGNGPERYQNRIFHWKAGVRGIGPRALL